LAQGLVSRAYTLRAVESCRARFVAPTTHALLMTSFPGMMMPGRGPPGLDEPDFSPGLHEVMKGWWRIIWCHERCHKQQNDELRLRVRKVAQLYGASLICLKKSRQFAVWMERAPRPPYVLITDWREAQPSMQAISQQSEQKHPMLIIVLCDSKRQFLRASEWARGLRADFSKVQVCERSNIPPSLLGGLVHSCFGCSVSPDMNEVEQSAATPFTLSDYLGDVNDSMKVDLGEPMYCVSALAQTSGWRLFGEEFQDKNMAFGCGSTDAGSASVAEDTVPSEEESGIATRNVGQAVCQTLWKQSCLLATAMPDGIML